MKENEIIEPGIGLLPAVNQTYYYIQSSLMGEGFFVKETQWIASFCDRLRLAKGNVYFDVKEANSVCYKLLQRLREINTLVAGERQKEQLIEKKHRAQQKAAERKRLCDEAEAAKAAKAKEKAKPLSDKEKAVRYEVNKQKRAKKKASEPSPHPDIIV